MMKEDAVVGVTTNPTIFQKAIAEGDAYDEQLKELLARKRSEGDLPAALGARRRRRDRPAREGAREAAAGRLRVVGGRSDACVRPRRDVRRGDAPARLARQAEPLREDPGDEAGARRDRGLHRAREEHQRHADLLAPAVHGSRRGLPARARAARRLRRRPVEGALVASFFVSRVDTEADKRLDAIGSKRRSRCAASSRSRTRGSPTSTTSRRSPAHAGSSSQARARRAALPLGVDLDEEPGVPRRDLRRGARRPGHRQHDAGGDDPRVPGSR